MDNVVKKCWAERYCKRKPDGCKIHCSGYLALKNLYGKSNMPKMYQYQGALKVEDADKLSYKKVKEYVANIEENVSKGNGLYLYGRNTGTGKTSIATRILGEYFRKKAFTSNLRCIGVFIECSKFLEDYRSTYTEPSDEFSVLLRNVMSADIVVFDDIGVEKVSEWVINRMYDIINHRVANGLVNIFTSNKKINEIEDTLGSRVASRIYSNNEFIEFKGSDKRRAE